MNFNKLVNRYIRNFNKLVDPEYKFTSAQILKLLLRHTHPMGCASPTHYTDRISSRLEWRGFFRIAGPKSSLLSNSNKRSRNDDGKSTSSHIQHLHHILRGAGVATAGPEGGRQFRCPKNYYGQGLSWLSVFAKNEISPDLVLRIW